MRQLPPATILAFTATMTLLLLGWDLIFIESIDLYFKEGVGIEQVTVVLLVWAIGLLVWRLGLRRSLREWQLPLALLLMALRELDFDKRFTDQGVLKLRYYTSSEPLSDKLPGILLLLVLALMLYRLARRNLMPWLRGLRQRDLCAWLVAAAGVAGVIAKSIDGLARKLAPFGIEVPAIVDHRAGRIEELLEMLFVFLLIQAIVTARGAAPGRGAR
ncbi:hypothetical protein FAZ78_12995 [Cereibacter changlensis]|uniref:Uncharacterized protein n=1 Tax=Cereibacter changlensis TaxID=402884 RepID=A0A4U0YTY7_9RHOB|nr:hypothetical protein [Cereibacter changlensis]TKA96150.1 hypothetical protein FAZ78_12995 [Cereibacter changlensis]